MLLCALVLLVASTPSADAGLVDAGVTCPGPRCVCYPSPRAAFAQVMRTRPLQVLAIGEYHEVTGAPKVKSAIRRFTEELLPTLKGRATSLIAETWMLNGKCGQVERHAAEEVKKVTQRPDETEDEVTTMLGRAYDLGLANHILVIGCDDYRSMLDDAGELDPDKSLLLVRRKVEEKARQVRDKGEGGVDDKLLLLYGGAIHNDLAPQPGYEPYSFGPSLFEATDGGYLELDLLVPEYVERDEDLTKEPWFASALALTAHGNTVLVTPRPNVALLLFAKKRGAR